MPYFPDLSPYSYGRDRHPDVVHIGWLDGTHPFPTGTIEPSLIENMKRLAARPVELYRGRHICEICVGAPNPVTDVLHKGRAIKTINPEWATWAEHRWGNGEIRVAGGGITFAAPVLIIHYIEEHRYLPPAQFLQAVAKTIG